MWNALMWMQKNLTWSIPLSMLTGIAYGQLVDPSVLRQAILPLTFLMVYPMMVSVNLKEVFKPGGGKLQGVTLLINFVFIPLLGYALGLVFFSEQPLIRLGLLLTSLLPTSGMTISWTGFAKGNVPAAIRMTVLGLILGSLLAPLYLKALMGTVLDIPLTDMFVQILVIVFLPLLLGYVTQRWLVVQYGSDTFNVDIKPKFAPFSTLGVLSIVFVSMALKSQAIVSQPVTLLRYLLPLLVIYAINFSISTVVGRKLFVRADGIALVYGTVMRNLSIALAIAMGVFGARGAEVALLISLAYIVQVQAAAWYVKFTDRLFGPFKT
jgi:ACR3 family arsenite transporter